MSVLDRVSHQPVFPSWRQAQRQKEAPIVVRGNLSDRNRKRPEAEGEDEEGDDGDDGALGAEGFHDARRGVWDAHHDAEQDRVEKPARAVVPPESQDR